MKIKETFMLMLTHNENLARSRISANSVRKIDRVRSSIGSLGFLVNELRGDIRRIEFDSFACKDFLAVDGPAWSWFWIRCVRNGYRERFSGNHRHVTDAEVGRDLWWD